MNTSTHNCDMTAGKFLRRHSLSYLDFNAVSTKIRAPSSAFFPGHNLPSRNPDLGFKVKPYRLQSRSYGSVQAAAVDDAVCSGKIEEETRPIMIRKMLQGNQDMSTLMKMERRTEPETGCRWFPYLDKFRAGTRFLSSQEVLDVVEQYIIDSRMERFKNAVNNRSYSVCLVVEGLSDLGNVSAVFRSADALGIQSVHVVSNTSKRYQMNRNVGMGAEKWLDIELWDSAQDCFEVLRSRGYRVATTHVGMDTVSIYDMDWSCPTAIVVGNEGRGISEEALKMSDLHCSIPMKGMVDSFNVSVASGILMHHAVCDRTSRMGAHGDLTSEERQILLAEFSLRHNRNAVGIVCEYAKRMDMTALSNP